MAISANKYANKIYSEHPIALWSLDDEAYYLSLIDDTNRLFSNWDNANAEDRVNLVTNPSFETGSTGWAPVGTGATAAINTTHKVFGSQSYVLTVGTANSYIQIGTNVPVIGGKTYTFSSYLKLVGGTSSGGTYIEVVWRDSANAVISLANNAGTQTVNSTTWTRHSVTSTAPSNAAFAQLRPLIATIAANPTGTQIAMDAVMFEQSSSVGTYFDGSYGGGAWTGAANASASVIHVKDRVNLIPNPSVEVNVAGWNGNNTSSVVRSTAQFIGGSASALATYNTLGTGGAGIFWWEAAGTGPGYLVTAGKTYTFSVYVRSNSETRSYSPSIAWRDSDVAAGSQISVTTGVTTSCALNTWTRVSVTGVAPVGAKSAVMSVYTTTATTAGNTAYFDSAMFEESQIAYPYFDPTWVTVSYGGVAYPISATWSGTANASTSTLTQWTANDSPTIPDTTSPFPNGVYTSVIKSNYLAGVVEVESPEIFDILDLDSSNTSFTVNTFLYHNPTYINWFKIGYRYTNAGVVNTVVSSEIPPLDSTGWININQTFSLPSSYTGGIRVFIQANFKNSTAGDTASRTVIMNGLSVGQGSSLTCYESLGSTAIDLPSELGFPSLKGISADQYGTLSDNGYYIVKSNKILAHNEAMSMIYGTDNSTRVESSGSSDPSLIFPGKGMLHENGRNKEFTFEMWMKIDPQTFVAKRIVGPLDSTDGVYVKEGFITLVIGDSIGSHYVGEWYRPMLMQVILKESNAILMINGEEVINIFYPRATVALSSGRDWWGIYSYTSTKFFSVHCIAIYPYVVSEALAKRRFVYGQGTENIQTLDAAYSGTPTVIDFPTAEYGANVIYPDAYRWDAGYFNNLDATRDYISVPNYTLPNINIGGRDLQEWYDNNYTINLSEYPERNHPNFVSFRPNQVTRTNLVTNPSFEVDTSGWSATGTTILRSVSQNNIGSASLELTHTTTGSTSSGVNILNRVIVEAGKTYTVSAYVKVTSGTTRSFRIRRTWYNSVTGGSAIGGAAVSAGTSVGTSSGWVRIKYSVLAPAGAVALTFRIEQSTASVIGDIWYVDNVLVEEAGDFLPYFDGSYSDPSLKPISYGWTGTAHASTSALSYWDSNGINYQDPSYFNFPSLNVLNDEVASVYGVFEPESNIASDRTLISFANTINGDTFDIKINADEVIYALNGTELYSEVVALGNEILVGLHIPSAAEDYGYEVSKFFSSPSSIQVYVGGNGVNTFEGKIYTVGFCNNNNYSKVVDNFYAVGTTGGGFAKADNYEALIDHIASYTLIPEYEYDKLFLDISVASEWEEFYPLSYFASYTKDANGDTVYDIDMLQLNLGYFTVDSAIWTYADLATEFAAPDDYADLAASVYASSYLNLKKQNSAGTTTNVSNSSLQGYLTFQPIADGANNPLSSFTYTKPLETSRIIYVDDENTVPLPMKVYDTKFVFTDDTLVFPPVSQPFEDYAMVVHLDIKQRAILTNPLKIKRFEITTKPYNENSSTTDQRTHIGTKFGRYVYPYVQTGSSLNNKGKKPLSISKITTPYLYNSSKTGIGIRNEAVQGITPVSDTQIFIPINENGSRDYLVSSLQFMIKPNFDDTDETIKLLHIRHKGGTLAYALVKDGTEYAILREYTKDSETVYTSFSYANFYQNGRYVPSPILRNNEWATVGLVFPNGLDFSEFVNGGVTIFGGARFNNISYYLSDGLGIQTTLSTRVWQDVLDANGVGTTLWSYWSGGSWFNLYVLDITSSYVVTPADIYDAYMGTNGNVVDDGKGLQINQGQTKIITDASWSLISGKPV